MDSDPTVSHDNLVRLRESGWRHAADGWRHPRLFFAWPVWFAIRLQGEADRGHKDPVHLILREEAWP